MSGVGRPPPSRGDLTESTGSLQSPSPVLTRHSLELSPSDPSSSRPNTPTAGGSDQVRLLPPEGGMVLFGRQSVNANSLGRGHAQIGLSNGMSVLQQSQTARSPPTAPQVPQPTSSAHSLLSVPNERLALRSPSLRTPGGSPRSRKTSSLPPVVCPPLGLSPDTDTQVDAHRSVGNMSRSTDISQGSPPRLQLNILSHRSSIQPASGLASPSSGPNKVPSFARNLTQRFPPQRQALRPDELRRTFFTWTLVPGALLLAVVVAAHVLVSLAGVPHRVVLDVEFLPGDSECAAGATCALSVAALEYSNAGLLRQWLAAWERSLPTALLVMCDAVRDGSCDSASGAIAGAGALRVGRISTPQRNCSFAAATTAHSLTLSQDTCVVTLHPTSAEGAASCLRLAPAVAYSSLRQWVVGAGDCGARTLPSSLTDTAGEVFASGFSLGAWRWPTCGRWSCYGLLLPGAVIAFLLACVAFVAAVAVAWRLGTQLQLSLAALQDRVRSLSDVAQQRSPGGSVRGPLSPFHSIRRVLSMPSANQSFALPSNLVELRCGPADAFPETKACDDAMRTGFANLTTMLSYVPQALTTRMRPEPTFVQNPLSEAPGVVSFAEEPLPMPSMVDDRDEVLEPLVMFELQEAHASTVSLSHSMSHSPVGSPFSLSLTPPPSGTRGRVVAPVATGEAGSVRGSPQGNGSVHTANDSGGAQSQGDSAHALHRPVSARPPVLRRATPAPSNHSPVGFTLNPSGASGVFGSMSDMLGRDAGSLTPSHGPAAGGPIRPSLSTAANVLDMVQVEEDCGLALGVSLRIKRCTVMYCALLFAQPVLHAHLSDEDLDRYETLTQQFLDTVLQCASMFDGIVTHMTADGALVSWNAFAPYHFHEVRACLCALHLASCLDALDREPAMQHLGGYCCLSISSGSCVAGWCGTESNVQPTIVGECVVFAKRLSRLGPMLACTAFVMESTYTMAKSHVLCVPVDVIGQERHRITLFELRCALNDPYAPSAQVLELYTSAFTALTQAQFQELARRAEACRAVALEASPTEFRIGEAPVTTGDQAIAQLARRLVVAAKHLRTHPAGTTGPWGASYARRMPAWAIHEDMSPQDKGYAVELALVSPRASSFRRRLTSIALSPEEILRSVAHAEILVEHSEGESSRSSSRANTALPDPAVVPTEPPSPMMGARPPSSLTAGALRGRSLSNLSSLDVEPDYRFESRDRVAIVGRRTHEEWTRSDRVLGSGSFGTVYLGLNARGELGALKYVAVDPEQQSQAHLAEVVSEVKLLAKLRHESIVAYYGTAVTSTALVVCMEYCSGGSLNTLLARFGALSQLTVQRYARDMLAGLQYLHKHGIAHRDVSLNNVLLTTDGDCKLTDFGASFSTRNRAAPAAGGSPFTQRLDRTVEPHDTRSDSPVAGPTNVVGTPLFMAPEACRGAPEQASDVWSLGVLLCCLASGEAPYPPSVRDDPAALVRQIAAAEVTPAVPDCAGPQLSVLLRSCLEQDPEDRASCEDLLHHPFFLQ